MQRMTTTTTTTRERERERERARERENREKSETMCDVWGGACVPACVFEPQTSGP